MVYVYLEELRGACRPCGYARCGAVRPGDGAMSSDYAGRRCRLIAVLLVAAWGPIQEAAGGPVPPPSGMAG